MQPRNDPGKGSDKSADPDKLPDPPKTTSSTTTHVDDDGPVRWDSPKDDRIDRVDHVDLVAEDEHRESRAERLRRRFSPGGEVRDAEVRDEPVDDNVAGAVAAPASRAVVTEDDIEVLTKGEDLGIYRAHRRYGGFDAGAAIAGLLSATGMTAVLGGIAGAIGTIGYQLETGTTDTLSTTGFVAGLVVLVASFLFGGWVAGRVARYDGGLNGLVAAGLFVALSAVMAGMGAWFGERYDVFADIRLPQWFSNMSNATAVLSAVVAFVGCIVAGWFGGVLGSRYHRKADTYLAEYAQGGRPVTAEALIDDSQTRRRHLLHR